MYVSKYKQECIEELRREIRLCEDCDNLYSMSSGCPVECSLSTHYKYWSPNNTVDIDGRNISRFKNLLINVSLSDESAEEKLSTITKAYKESCSICYHRYTPESEHYYDYSPCSRCRTKSMYKADQKTLSAIKEFAIKVSVRKKNERI